MGYWTYQRKQGESIADLIIRTEFTNENIEVIKSCVKLREGYFAYRNKVTGEVSACVACFSYEDNGASVRVKMIDEEMGPYYWNAPASILDLLTPTKNETAQIWRSECRAVIAKRKGMKDLVGKVIRIGRNHYRITEKVGRCYLGYCGAVRYRIRPRDLERAEIVDGIESVQAC